jgi:hypothetical protein
MLRRISFLLIFLAALGSLCLPSPAPAYIGGPPLSLGLMCSWSTHVMIAQIERIDPAKTVIIFRKVRDVKGKWPTEVFRQHFNPAFPDREHIFHWAEPGKTVVVCALESYKWSHTYIDKVWYASNTNDWQVWNVSHSEPLLLRMYAGKTDRLVGAVSSILAGKEVIVPGMVDGPVEDLVKRRAKYQTIKSSLKLLDYNPGRDFIRWGSDDFNPLAGMPGFSHSASLGKLGSDVHAMASADFDGDGKPDLCLVSSHKIALLLNGGDYFAEILLPGFQGPCRSVVAADYNGDGKPDILVATPSGLRLYTNLGQGNFRDDSPLLPREENMTLTAAAWLDYDADGRPDILLANGYQGLRLYRNKGPGQETGGGKKEAGDRRQEAGGRKQEAMPSKTGKKETPPALWFEDRSELMGLGSGGAGAGLKGDTLAVCDVNQDGWADFLYGAEGGLLFMNTPFGFVPMNNPGISFVAGKVGPVFGDFNNDGHPDLFVPQNGQCKLFQGDGRGRFVDVTLQAGDVAKPISWVTSAAWGDVDNDGHLDLVIGCLRGPNRYLRNRGDGTFEDGTEALGLYRRIFNTQSVCLTDLNLDGTLDMVFHNENQESIVLLGNGQQAFKRTAVTINVAGTEGLIGSQVQVFDQQGKRLFFQEISGGEGRCQPPPLARFALDPGNYRVQVRYSSGLVRGCTINVARSPLRGKIDEQTAIMGE